MSNSRLFGLASLVLLSPLALAGCGDDNPSVEEKTPFSEDWEMVVDGVTFPAETGCIGANDACGTAPDEETCATAPAEFECEWVASAVTNMRIGGRLSNDNFANRGDIEVYYTNDDSTISVEMRRFTFASTDAEAEENLKPMNFWAFAEPNPSPGPDPANDCRTVWKNDCQIRVWYDGLTQPLRDGADFRVYLPKAWEGNLTVATEDAEQEAEKYPRRSNITIKGARGNVFVDSVGAGTVEIEMSPDLEEAPLDCTTEQHDACDDLGWPTNPLCVGDGECGDLITETMCDESADSCTWASCICGTGSAGFGQVEVTSISGRAANITLEVPSDLWTTVRMNNEEPGLNPSSEPFCPNDLACDDFGSCMVDEGQSSCVGNTCWKTVAELNDPGDAATPMAGFRIDLTSTNCTDVPTAREPGDFEDFETIEKGHVTVCSDCLDISVP